VALLRFQLMVIIDELYVESATFQPNIANLMQIASFGGNVCESVSTPGGSSAKCGKNCYIRDVSCYTKCVCRDIIFPHDVLLA
jgi:hypothetical protein